MIAKKARKKPEPRTLFFTVRKACLIDHTTGELLRDPVGVLAPRDGLQRRYMRERKYHVGTELQGQLKKARDYQQLKVLHGLGLMCAEQIEGFEMFAKDAHGAIKRLQRESGIACEVRDMAAGPVVDALLAAAATFAPGDTLEMLHDILGDIDTITVTEAQSLSYESMDAGHFNEVFTALCNHVLKTYWPQLEEETGRAKIMAWIGENAQ